MPKTSSAASDPPVVVTYAKGSDGVICWPWGPVIGTQVAGPVRVVLYDHNYTPDKSIQETGVPPQGHTWHWDNIVVR